MDVHFCTPPGPIGLGIAHAEVILHRHAREQAAVLRRMRDAELDYAVGRRGDEVDAFHMHAAAHRADQSGDDAHQV